MRLPLLTVATALFAASTAKAADPLSARVLTEDVDRFYRVYDAAAGRPAAEALARDYITSGSPGVRDFVPHRIESAEALAATIRQSPDVCERARACRPALPAVQRRTRAAYLAFQQLLPGAKLPDTTILIGRNNSGGTAKPSGVLIGLEVVCDPAPGAVPVDVRLAHLVAHELAHTQQAYFRGETLLDAALNEGVAEFVGELISGAPLNERHAAQTAGREAEIEGAFAAEMHGTDKSRWLYNGAGTAQWPGDLGYWIGYRIAKSYFDRAPDKRAAVRTMLQSTDAKAFLAASGWTPARPA